MPRRKSDAPLQHLSRRERQIMDVVYRRGRVTIQDVLADLPDPPSYSAVRALVKVLEEKGQLTHTQEGPRYVYTPTVERARAGHSALRHLMDTFFQGSASETVATLLELKGEQMSLEELDELEALIARARKEES